MNWQQPNKWYVQSDEGYRVAKMMSDGQPKYLPYPPQKRGETAKSLGVYKSASKAKKACEQHVERSKESDNHK